MATSLSSVQKASKIILFARQLFYLKSCSHTAFKLQPCFFQVSPMSQYSPIFLDPIIDKDELKKELPENDLRRHRPLKAPNTDCSISPLFYDPTVQKFTNIMMKSGNKERVRLIMRKLFENLKHMQIARWNQATTLEEKSAIECDPLVLFKTAIDNCKPLLLTQRIVKGGIAYRVPVCARPKEQTFRAMKWILESCRDKERRIPMEDKLTLELMDAYNHQGKAMRKKQEVHKICESNRAYAHLR
ncbi:28S ribosomal protein S7, mitochondrial-like [Biomphalaria glabrata]|uniref:28S ribosomal protein S7, mitochondrial-like n=1 Tax=Biomphalaria glabrata TaxID=6526 RepID=A0A9W2ZRT0_BIOGL|nr:28S ribosomal protein S7, mitochondrial-like [Biomphalaria glabrata]KAI8731598.1 28S ribosomal protein S7; mitochondrial-like [Biomphalaria glabrata]